MITFKNVNLISTSLERLAFSDEVYRIVTLKSLESYKIEIEISNRCKRVAGNIRVMKSCNYVKINISNDYYKEFGIERSIGTLRHELAHLVGYIKTGRVDHGEVFKRECLALGGTMNPKMAGRRFADSACSDYIRGSIKNYKYVYSCPNCSNKIERSRKISDATKRKACGRCHTKVSLWSEQYVAI
jgi:predicted SprT family Zn-dependent metalloprotease